MLRFQGLAFFFLATLVHRRALAIPNEWSSDSLSWIVDSNSPRNTLGDFTGSRAVRLSVDALQTLIDKVVKTIFRFMAWDTCLGGRISLFGARDGVQAYESTSAVPSRFRTSQTLNPEAQNPSFLISTKDCRPQKNHDRVF